MSNCHTFMKNSIYLPIYMAKGGQIDPLLRR